MSEPYWEPLGATPAVAPSRVVGGSISSAGVKVAGGGFTVVRNTTGDYTITFAPAFSAAPLVIVQIGYSVVWNRTAMVMNVAGTADSFPTAASFRVLTRDTGGNPQDTSFSFFATDMPT
jgi:hypothetical protein